MPALEVHGLVKIYGSRRVVDVVDFHVDSGEIVGLLGPMMELLGLDWHERCIRCDLLLEYVGIAQLRTLPARALSGGERRRLEIARCLVSDPKILLLDEPFTGIDPATIQCVQRIIRNFHPPWRKMHVSSVSQGLKGAGANSRGRSTTCTACPKRPGKMASRERIPV